MGCGGDYRFQSRGRTAVGFYHPAERLTASLPGIFMPNLRSVLGRTGVPDVQEKFFSGSYEALRELGVVSKNSVRMREHHHGEASYHEHIVFIRL